MNVAFNYPQLIKPRDFSTTSINKQTVKNEQIININNNKINI